MTEELSGMTNAEADGPGEIDGMAESFDFELRVRSIVDDCVIQEYSADDIRLCVIGYSRALNVLACTAVNSTRDKQVATDGVKIHMACQVCEDTMKMIANSEVMEKYAFGGKPE